MKIHRRGMLAGSVALLHGAMARAQTPASIASGQLWPDDRGLHINAHGGGVLHHQGRYWWYGEHKVAGDAGNRAQVGVHVYSSADLMHWRDEGICLSVSHQPGDDLEAGCILERPKVLFDPQSKRFVMWFHLELKGQGYASARAGVAVAEQPQGPFTYLRSARVNPGVWPINATPEDCQAGTKLARDFSGGQMCRDMTLFVDDDGRAYHIYASEDNQTLQIAELAPDLTRHSGRYARILPGLANEAPALFKHDGRYFLIASGTTGWAPNPARLYVADNLFGPWQAHGNPVRGTPEQMATTFGGQSTFILPIKTANGTQRLIFMADIWQPKNAIDGRYIWLPIDWEDGLPVLRWTKGWTP
ncbi:glycoside hydrolase family 43 protein [Novosphingobium terrae]|uniref:glycoside hydrolase family 43 protein n=1 Tax=Novosphingobium terrae TaxID=2726189 RepID=UPI00197D7C91|nr:glycoside hydrolase family 43 protein [Novosphingobium terrae]